MVESMLLLSLPLQMSSPYDDLQSVAQKKYRKQHHLYRQVVAIQIGPKQILLSHYSKKTTKTFNILSLIG